jgi:hypothetical protein
MLIPVQGTDDERSDPLLKFVNASVHRSYKLLEYVVAVKAIEVYHFYRSSIAKSFQGLLWRTCALTLFSKELSKMPLHKSCIRNLSSTRHQVVNITSSQQ